MDSILTQPGGFVVGCNYWASHAGSDTWRDWQPEVIRADLRQLAEGGLQVLRVFPLWPDFQPITLLRGGGGAPREIRLGEQPLPDSETGRAGVSEIMLERFQFFADEAERNGLKLVVGLLTGWMSGRLYVPPALEGLNVLSDPLAMSWEIRFVRCFVRRFKQHPAINAWDLGNEVNSMARVTPAEAYTWTSAITGAIRREDPSRPIVSGLHGDIAIWSPEMLGENLELLTTHPYPYWTAYADQDPVNTMRTILHSTSESLLYAGLGGRPCLAEEVGTLGAMLASDAIAADFIRSCLFSLWAHDCHGLLWWCAYDQEHLAHAPYDWNTCERELGLFRSDRSPKPVLAELGNFRHLLAALPASANPLPARRCEAVCLLPLDTDPWKLAYSSFILAKQAGFDLDFQYGEQALKEAAVYLVPSVRGVNVITRHRWLAVLEKVKAGATLYLSLDDAILSGFEETFGLQVQTRQKRSAPVRLALDGAGEFSIGASFRLNLRAAGAEVLGREEDGNPAFTRCAYGQGQIYFLSVPIERILTETPGAFLPGAPAWWKVYAQVAESAMAGRVVSKANPLVGLSEHPLNENERWVVAINYSPDALEEDLRLADGWQVSEVAHGELDGLCVRIKGNDAVVFHVRKM